MHEEQRGRGGVRDQARFQPRHHGHAPPFSLGFGFRDGFGLINTSLVVVSGYFRIFQDVSARSVLNDHDSSCAMSVLYGKSRVEYTGACENDLAAHG